MEKVDREPCPWRIVDDAGGAFVFGLAGGTVWHMIGGARNAPSGQRWSQAISRTRARVPILGGSFAVWGVLFSCCDCTFTYYRKKEDPWNAIMSGAATGGILAARAGLKAAGKSALVGGVILAAIEGLNILVMRVIMPAFEKQQQAQMGLVDKLEPPVDPLKPRRARKQQVFDSPAPSPMFAGGFGGFSLDSNPLSSSTSSGSSGGTSQWDTPLGADPFMKPSAEPTSTSSSTGSSSASGSGSGSGWKFW